MKKIKVGLNGIGRIGRAFVRIAHNNPNIEIALINTRRTPNDMIAYLLRYDSVYKTYPHAITHNDRGICIGDTQIPTSQCTTPSEIPWGDYGVEVVVDATGAFMTEDTLEAHLHSFETHESHSGIAHSGATIASAHMKSTVKKVILTAPAKDDLIPHVVLGVNDAASIVRDHPVISNASCTTNCAAPLFKVLHDAFGIVMGQMTTIHAYTISQSLLDDANGEFDRSRNAVLNVIPSTSGAAKAVVKVIPDLKGKIDVFAVRVPVPTGSASDLSVVVNKNVTVDEVNAVFKRASETNMKGILGYNTDLIVTSDIVGSSYSCIFDANYTRVTAGNMIKIFGWYDNEWGYTSRVVDLVTLCGSVI